MTPASVFQLSSILAGIGWIAVLVASPFWPAFDKFLIGVVIALMAVVYTWLNFSQPILGTMKGFSTFDGVMTIFTNPVLVNAAWVHILAIDLLMAAWIKKNAMANGISHAWTLPALLVAIPFAPLGFLVYLLTRWIKTGQYFARN